MHFTPPTALTSTLGRRGLLAWVARFGLAAASLGLSGGFARRASAQAPRYDGRLIDAHTHLEWDEFTDFDALVRIHDAAGVDGAWLFGYPWSLATDASAAHPARVVPFLAEGYLNTLHPDSSYLNPEGLEELLAGGFVRGLGEIILRHSPFRLGPEGGGASSPPVNVPADEPRLLEAYRVAGRHGAPVNVHQEWFFSEELERALDAAPDTTFVWAHAGHGPAGLVGQLLERHPNLHADLSARTPWIGPGTVLLRPDGQLDPAWQAVLERFPERFLIGLDLFAPAHYRVEYVRMLAEYYRRLLGLLPGELAEQLAYGNAERLAPFRGVEA
ncbi:MAG: amidohydrolase family protein [Chloroflexi bacterium]|nr:amidohydrolase family protein [Chloroflexota bacterium]